MPNMFDDSFVREAIRSMYLDGELQAPPVTAHELRMHGTRSRLRVGFKLPVAVAAAVLLVVALFAVPLHHHVQSSPSNSNRDTTTGWQAADLDAGVLESELLPRMPLRRTSRGPRHRSIRCCLLLSVLCGTRGIGLHL